MTTPLIPQEIFLLERYASVPYFSEMRDAWAAMVKHAEKCLYIFVRALPADYRKRMLEDQPDIVWGERVIPNFRSTLSYLNTGFIELTHGDLSALGYAGNVNSDFAGFVRDYSSDWMDEPHVSKVIANGSEEFWRFLGQATKRASNIKATFYAHWVVGSLTNRYNDPARGPREFPPQWPSYRQNGAVRATTDKPAPRSGIYLPDCSDSVAALLIEGKDAPPASVGFDPKTTQNLSTTATSWTLVERVADGGGGIPGDPDPLKAGVRLRCEARRPCPRAGYWFTPARPGGRRSFEQGDVMPDVGGDYGVTIWQWDEQQ